MRKNKSLLTYYDDESPWTTELRRLARNIKYSGFAPPPRGLGRGARHNTPEIGNRDNHRAITGRPVVETTGYADTNDVLMGDALSQQKKAAEKSRRVGSRWMLETGNPFDETQKSLVNRPVGSPFALPSRSEPTPSAGDDYEAMKNDFASTHTQMPDYRSKLPNAGHRVVGEVEIPEIKSVLITSSVEEEGKSLIASNLAITMAKDEPDKDVLLIDCDMRKPKQHELFALEREPGLSSILTGEASLDASISQSELENLWVIPSGDFVESPPRLLASQKARELIKACSDFFDMVIIDAPPIIPVNDPAVLAPYADGVLLVVAAKKTFRETIQRAIELIETAQANFLGVVLNKVDIKRGRYYYSYGYK